MTSRSITDLHPDIQPLCREFLAQCHAESIFCFLTCTYRSNTEQDEDYAKGRTAPGKIITNARAGQSKHNFTIADKPASKAFDVAVKGNDGLDWDVTHPCWQRTGEIGKSLGLTWGGDFHSIKDYPHFEIN